jgi:hypothetical protein
MTIGNTRASVLRYWGWESRLAYHQSGHLPDYRSRCGMFGALRVDTNLTRHNAATDCEYELEVRVEGVWVHGERGDAFHPDVPEAWEDVQASFFRPGKGWVFLELTPAETEWAISVLENCARERRHW